MRYAHGGRGARNKSSESKGRSERPSFGEAVGPGFVPDLDGGRGPMFGRRGGHRHGGPGGFPGGPGGFPGGPGGRGPRGRGPRARGDVRAAILLLLEEGPRHGYQLIQEVGERSGGTWSPSPGSIYPALQALEDEGLVTIEPVVGRKTASLTDAGREYVAQNREELGNPWEAAGRDRGRSMALREGVIALVEACKQVGRVGSPAQQAAAVEVLETARRGLYGILAAEPPAADGTAPATAR